MEPDNMIYRLQTAASPETIKPGDKTNPTFSYIPKMTSAQTGSLTVGAHSDTQSGWCYEKRQLYCFFFSLSIWYGWKCPPTADDISLLISSVIVIAHIQNKRTNISKGNCPNFYHRLCFLQRFFFYAHFKSIASERFLGFFFTWNRSNFQIKRWKAMCRIRCDLANTELTWRLFMLTANFLFALNTSEWH